MTRSPSALRSLFIVVGSAFGGVMILIGVLFSAVDALGLAQEDSPTAVLLVIAACMLLLGLLNLFVMPRFCRDQS